MHEIHSSIYALCTRNCTIHINLHQTKMLIHRTASPIRSEVTWLTQIQTECWTTTYGQHVYFSLHIHEKFYTWLSTSPTRGTTRACLCVHTCLNLLSYFVDYPCCGNARRVSAILSRSFQVGRRWVCWSAYVGRSTHKHTHTNSVHCWDLLYTFLVRLPSVNWGEWCLCVCCSCKRHVRPAWPKHTHGICVIVYAEVLVGWITISDSVWICRHRVSVKR